MYLEERPLKGHLKVVHFLFNPYNILLTYTHRLRECVATDLFSDTATPPILPVTPTWIRNWLLLV